MILTLHGGPQGSCHFKCGWKKPPAEVRVPGPRQTTAVYQLTGWKRRGQYTDTWVYGKSKVVLEEPPPLVRFVE